MYSRKKKKKKTEKHAYSYPNNFRVDETGLLCGQKNESNCDPHSTSYAKN